VDHPCGLGRLGLLRYDSSIAETTGG
jgi:hypothetical protein